MLLIFTLENVDLRHATMTNVTCNQARLMNSRFDYAKLNFSSFWRADLYNVSFHGVDLRTVDFSRANLQRVDFTNASITDRQLRSALSIRNARLPNGTLGRDPNLLKNGHADCNTSVHQHWQVREGGVVATSSGRGPRYCHFAAQASNTEAMMSQRISLADIWSSYFGGSPEAVLLARLAGNVSVQITGISNTGQVMNRQILRETNCAERIIIHRSSDPSFRLQWK